MASLPSELWSIIVKLLDRRDLRSARLVNKELSALSTTKLFDTIFLRPTKTSFVHSVCIAESPKLSTMVLRLECIGERLDGYQTSREGFDREVGETLAGLEPDLEKKYSKLGRDYLYTNFRSRLASQDEWSDSHYVAKVKQLAIRLPRLVELWCITANNENIETYWGTDHDWLFRYGHSRSIHFDDFTADVFFDLFARRIFERIHLDPLSMDDDMFDCLSSYSPESLHAQLQCVTRATLVLLNYVPVIEHRNLEHWSSFLAALRNVRRLEITCRVPDDFQMVLDHNVWSVILDLQWPRLKTATFTGLVCEEEELLGFVSNNSQSLARVELMSLHLVRRTGPEIDADRIAAPANKKKWPSIIHLHQTPAPLL